MLGCEVTCFLGCAVGRLFGREFARVLGGALCSLPLRQLARFLGRFCRLTRCTLLRRTLCVSRCLFGGLAGRQRCGFLGRDEVSFASCKFGGVARGLFGFSPRKFARALLFLVCAALILGRQIGALAFLCLCSRLRNGARLLLARSGLAGVPLFGFLAQAIERGFARRLLACALGFRFGISQALPFRQVLRVLRSLFRLAHAKFLRLAVLGHDRRGGDRFRSGGRRRPGWPLGGRRCNTSRFGLGRLGRRGL